MTSGERSASVKCRQVWRKVREMLAGNQFVDIAQVQCNFCGSRSSCGNWWHTVTHGRGSEGWNWWMEWVASTLTPPPNVVYPALLKLMGTPRLPAVDWTDAPTDLNGLVCFGERRNLVSARMPSRSARAILLVNRVAWLYFTVASKSNNVH